MCGVWWNPRLAQAVIRKLISGGQTGADSCIIRVGSRLGIPIGGLVPRGWQTEQGTNPALREFGFTESSCSDYAARTRKNVENSDATLIFANRVDSDGTALTVDHAEKIGRPFLVVDPFDPTAVETIASWLQATHPQVLNVAGNRESVAPGIAEQSEQVLHAVLSR